MSANRILLAVFDLPRDDKGKLTVIRTIIAQEFGKTELELKNFKKEMCMALEVVEQKFDNRLATIEQKIDLLGKGPMNLITKLNN